MFRMRTAILLTALCVIGSLLITAGDSTDTGITQRASLNLIVDIHPDGNLVTIEDTNKFFDFKMDTQLGNGKQIGKLVAKSKLMEGKTIEGLSLPALQESLNKKLSDSGLPGIRVILDVETDTTNEHMVIVILRFESDEAPYRDLAKFNIVKDRMSSKDKIYLMVPKYRLVSALGLQFNVEASADSYKIKVIDPEKKYDLHVVFLEGRQVARSKKLSKAEIAALDGLEREFVFSLPDGLKSHVSLSVDKDQDEERRVISFGFSSQIDKKKVKLEIDSDVVVLTMPKPSAQADEVDLKNDVLIYRLKYADPERVAAILVQMGIVGLEDIQLYSDSLVNADPPANTLPIAITDKAPSGGQDSGAPAASNVTRIDRAAGANFIPVNPDLNTMIPRFLAIHVTGTAEKSARVRKEELQKFIEENLDVSSPAIDLEVRVCEVNETNMKDLGLAVDGLSDGGDTLTVGALRTDLSEELASDSDPLKLGDFHRESIGLRAVMDMLLTNSKAKLLAQPVLTTIEGDKAEYFAGESIPVNTSTPILGLGETLQRTEVQYQRVGVLIQFVPQFPIDPVFSSLSEATKEEVSGYGSEMVQLLSDYLDDLVNNNEEELKFSDFKRKIEYGDLDAIDRYIIDDISQILDIDAGGNIGSKKYKAKLRDGLKDRGKVIVALSEDLSSKYENYGVEVLKLMISHFWELKGNEEDIKPNYQDFFKKFPCYLASYSRSHPELKWGEGGLEIRQHMVDDIDNLINDDSSDQYWRGYAFADFNSLKDQLPAVMLNVRIVVSSLGASTDLGNGSKAFRITERDLGTRVPVKLDQTVAIAGMIKESDITNWRKVPLLGDVPLIGKLFRSRNTTKERTEIVVLITPKLRYETLPSTILDGFTKDRELTEQNCYWASVLEDLKNNRPVRRRADYLKECPR